HGRPCGRSLFASGATAVVLDRAPGSESHVGPMRWPLFFFALVLAIPSAACSRGARPPEGDARPTTTAQSAATAASPVASAPAPTVELADAGAGEGDEKVPDIEYVPTPENVVDKMLEVAKITKGDVLYDLGCGDGRIVVTAA